MTYDENTECFYTPGTPGIIDIIDPRTNKGEYSREDLEDTRKRHPQAEIGNFDEICAAQADFWIKPPVEIDEARYDEMLNVLPPADWVHSGHTESFKMIERTSGNVTGIYCRVGEKFFHLENSITMRHHEIVALCKAA
jgi:hypothetical protein